MDPYNDYERLSHDALVKGLAEEWVIPVEDMRFIRSFIREAERRTSEECFTFLGIYTGQRSMDVFARLNLCGGRCFTNSHPYNVEVDMEEMLCHIR